MDNLIKKYNVAVPRYTSYPTVPHWEDKGITQEKWTAKLLDSYASHPEISLYIHLPFCEALCTYCGCNKRITKNHAVESPYIAAVIKEWQLYLAMFDQKPVIKEIHLGGGTPTFFSPDNLKLLIEGILKDVEVSNVHDFSFEAHPNSTTYEHLQTLYEVGFRRISIGVQDISPEILRAINRQQTADEVRQVTHQARSIGYTSVNYDIIYGLPFQKPINIMDTILFIQEMLPDRIAFYSYAHVPWKSASQRAFTLADVPQGRQKNELFELGFEMLKDARYSAIGMDHFCLEGEALYESYLKGDMHRNFMGYTPNYTKCSIALGTSGISDCWDMYVQNAKTVEEYQELVGQGQLPIVKGHILSSEEQIMRFHIINLMCNDYTYWSSIAPDAKILFPMLKYLEPLKQDGLVEYTSNSVTVTLAGKYFIRNICAALDPLLGHQDVDKPMFSQAV